MKSDLMTTEQAQYKRTELNAKGFEAWIRPQGAGQALVEYKMLPMTKIIFDLPEIFNGVKFNWGLNNEEYSISWETGTLEEGDIWNAQIKDGAGHDLIVDWNRNVLYRDVLLNGTADFLSKLVNKLKTIS